MGNKKKTMTDFKVIKKKVGKKAKPVNETSTKFQSKQIIIREQSVVSNLNSDENAVSSRGLTVEQLACQTRHYNPKVRKEAFAQLEELALRFNHSLAVKKAFMLNMEALADSGMRDLDQGARRAFAQVFSLLLQQGFPLTPLHVTTIINLLFVCLTEGEGLDRRVDATQTLDQLLQHAPLLMRNLLQPITIKRLVACYADLCRTVLGTNSSSLAKREAGVILRKATVGKIMEQMKERERLENLNKKLKRSKTTENTVVALENAFITERLVVVSRAVQVLAGLLPGAMQVLDYQTVLLPFLLAVLEMFRHSMEMKKPEAYVPCSQALWRIVDLCADRVAPQLAGEIRAAFATLDRFDLKRFDILTCISLRDDSDWLADCLAWFLKNGEVQNDAEVNERLLFTPELLSREQRQLVLDCFTARLSTALANGAESKDEVAWRLDLVRRLLDGVDAATRLVWCKDLPRAMWTLAGGSTLGPLKEISRCAAEVERTVDLGFTVLRQCALLQEEEGSGEKKEWTEIARAMSSFYAGVSIKTQQVVFGPYFRFSSALRTSLISLIAVLPVRQLPGTLHKNWCQTLMQEDVGTTTTLDGSLLVETAFAFARRAAAAPEGGEEEGAADLILSFALTCALKTKYTTLVCTLLKSLYRATFWPIATMLAPAVLDAKAATSPAWVEFASCVLSCGDGEEEEDVLALKRALAQVIGADWRLVTLASTLSNLTSAGLNPEFICLVSAPVRGAEEDGDGGNNNAVFGWIEFLLMANQHGYDLGAEWSWSCSPALQANAHELAQANLKLASNLKLLLLEKE